MRDGASETTMVSSGKVEGKGSKATHLTGGGWNPHQNCTQFATTNDDHVCGWDVRSMKQAWSVQECFSTTIR